MIKNKNYKFTIDKSKIKMLFLQLSIGGAIRSDSMEPLVFSILKSMTPQFIEVDFKDECIGDSYDIKNYDWIIMTATSFTIRRAYKVAKQAKKYGVKTAIGGFHVSAMPTEAMEYTDVVFVGDAEDTWPEFLKDLESGVHQQSYTSEFGEFTGITYDTSIFKDKKYPMLKSVQVSRGCKYNCEFCSIGAMYRGYRYRPVDEIIEEIKTRDLKLIFFADDNLYSSRDEFLKLIKTLAPLKVKWAAQVSIDIADDDEVMSLLADSGCIVLLIGFESLRQANLKKMRKGANLESSYDNKISKIYSYGIAIYATFVIGYDHDDMQSIHEIEEFCKRHSFFLANFNPIMAMPGTPLYERLENEGRLIKPKWWLDSEYRYGQSMVRLKNMNEDELEKGAYYLRSKFYSLSSILRRLRLKANRENTLTFLLTNLVSRKEIHRKQGTRL